MQNIFGRSALIYVQNDIEPTHGLSNPNSIIYVTEILVRT
jgi:hypothetical protein